VDGSEDEDEPASAVEELDSPAEGVSVSVVFAVSAGVVVVSAGVAASVGVVCSAVVVVWVGSVSAVCVVVDGDAAAGACEAALRAFVESVECVARFVVRLARAASPLLSVLFAALAVLPGKACAASSVKIPVSVAEPASSQRLQCFSRLRAASRERLVGAIVMGTYSTPLPSSH
jgi:hypothetical protein